MLDYSLYNQDSPSNEPPRPERYDAYSGNLSTIIDRIEQAVDEETVAIRSDVQFDIKSSNARKSRCLYDLTKAMKGVRVEDLRTEQRESIIRLKDKLVANEAAILAHLNAVTEVAALVQDAIQRAEADGTYSAGAFGRGV